MSNTLGKHRAPSERSLVGLRFEWCRDVDTTILSYWVLGGDLIVDIVAIGENETCLRC